MQKSMRSLIDSALNDIDQGFDSFPNRQISDPTFLDRYLLASTYHAIRLSKAIISLCESGFTNESIPVLRTLIEHSINMRWITNKNTKNRLKEYMYDLEEKGFGAKWTTVNLHDRMLEVGFKSSSYYNFCVRVTYDYAHANSTCLNWGEVIDHPQLNADRWSSESLYAVVVQMLAHVMKALDTRYEGQFGNFNQLWSKVPVDPQIDSKIAEVREKLKKNTHY